MWTRLAANMAFGGGMSVLKGVGRLARRIGGYGGRYADILGTRELGRGIGQMAGGGRTWMGGMGPHAGTYRTAGGINPLTRAGAARVQRGRGTLGAWARAGGDPRAQAARMGLTAGAAGGGVAGLGATADLLNPWGLGWGD